eukprot:4465908-Ditylum_brightwellii.AAC.1
MNPNFKEALMMLKEDIFDVSEMPRADQIKNIKQVLKPSNTRYQQAVSENDTMLSYLQYFAANLNTDGYCIHDKNQLVLSEDDYQMVLFKLAPTAWYDQLTADGKNTKPMILSEINQIFRQIDRQEKQMK